MHVLAQAISTRCDPHAIDAAFFQSGQMEERVSSEAGEVVDADDVGCMRYHVDGQNR
jgi:hypothetical protein